MGLYPHATLTPAAIIDADFDPYDLTGDTFHRLNNCDNGILPGITILTPNEPREGYDWSQDSIDPREGGAYTVTAKHLERQLETFKEAYAADLAKLPPHEVRMVFAAYQM